MSDVYYVGLDLAWGEHNPTGVAVLDEDGHLISISSCRSDDEIVAALGQIVGEDCVVAIDAPLIVTNPQGARPAETALNQDFAKYDAGAHPANTGKPEFRDTPRGARLAARLGLDIAPQSTASRRAIEVYPHPATVALFRLGRILKYKHKTGRSLALLRAELLRLTELVESLAGFDPRLDVRGLARWAELVAQVSTATRKSELRAVEDQIDSVVCAYVALVADRRPESLTTYGDGDSGYIVTPTLPVDLQPSPRVRRDPARRAVQTYAAAQPGLVPVTDGFVALVTALLDDAGINYLSVTGRTKTVTSFAAKAEREVDGQRIYQDPLTEITDQIGLRVITFVHGDVSAVADVLAEEFTILDDRDLGEETARDGRFGYASRHLLVAVEDGETTDLAGHRASIQVRTVLQHAWAEFEHDIRYKGSIPVEHARDLDRRFTLAAGLLELADREFTTIRDQLRTAIAETTGAGDDPRIDAGDLATFLGNTYPESGWSRADHYVWIGGVLLELGITSLDELGGLLGTLDTESLESRMNYRYPAGAVRRLDDALLAVFGTRYLALPTNAPRADLLRARLEKLRS